MGCFGSKYLKQGTSSLKFLSISHRANVIIEVEGGLGNTIFQYAAGRYLAKRIGTEVLVSTKHLEKAKANHGFYLTNIFPDIKFQDDDSLERFPIWNWIRENFERVLNGLALRNRGFAKICTVFFRTYRSHVLGFDVNLDTIKDPVNLRGYFQTWKYAQSLIGQDGFVPKLENPSIWYSEMYENAMEVHPVIMHVRRGDYQVHGDKYGLLSHAYYLNALKIIPEELRNNPIWVFSDDINLAKEMLENGLPLNTLWIDPPRISNPSESFMLMTLGYAHIIANSTFSYWAAQLSLTSQIVIAPKKWFKSMKDPQDLINPSWQLVESDWI